MNLTMSKHVSRVELKTAVFFIYILPVKVQTEIYNTIIMVQDLMIKLARKPKETIEAYKFWLPYDLKLTYRLKHEYDGRV